MMQKTDKIDINKIQDFYWKKQYNISQVAKRLGVSFWSLYGFMDKHNIQRRLPAEANYIVSRDKPQFKINENLINQFTKPYVRKGNLNLSNRKLPYGLVHIRYNDKKLLLAIKSWIENYKNNILIWAGTQVAKGDRLCKRSVLSKGRMEK